MMYYDRKKHERKYTFLFDDGRKWENIPASDLAGWVHYPFGPLNATVLDSAGNVVGRI